MNDDYVYGHIWNISVELEIKREKKKLRQPDAVLSKIR